MIRVAIEFELKQNYRSSLDMLLAFCCIWDSVIMYGGTNREKAIISMPSNHFKRIFKTNPELKVYSVPSGMEKFISSVRVKKIMSK
jgi:hypothetical protein